MLSHATSSGHHGTLFQKKLCRGVNKEREIIFQSCMNGVMNRTGDVEFVIKLMKYKTVKVCHYKDYTINSDFVLLSAHPNQ